MGQKINVDINTDICNNTLSNIIQDYNKNKKLYEVITYYKNQITDYYQNKSWDKYKKLTNEYEFVFTNSNASHNVSKYSPVSRSFFKLWEMLHDHKHDIFMSEMNECGNKGMKCLFLAEGPGGFVEAMMKFRNDYFQESNINDEYYGITLKSNNNRNIPDWKYKNKKLTLLFGSDGTGNIYNIDNIDNLCNSLRDNTVDFITGDGGFDFSSDFNSQEEMTFRLITCEIYSALRLQKVGGCFIIKVFDMFTTYSLQLLNILCECYDIVKLVKPLTSRPANSEKYLLCIGYKGVPTYINILRQVIEGPWKDNVSIEQQKLNIPLKKHVIKNLVIFNTLYISRQVRYIQSTIEYIKMFSKANENGSIKKIIDRHIEKAKKWCIKYDIPVNNTS